VRFDAGAADLLDVLDAERSQLAAQDAFADARTTTPGRSNFLKLGVRTSTRYVPGCRLVASYRPAASVSSVRGTPVASSVTRTAAPLMAEPCGSTTVPRIDPRKD